MEGGCSGTIPIDGDEVGVTIRKADDALGIRCGIGAGTGRSMELVGNDRSNLH